MDIFIYIIRVIILFASAYFAARILSKKSLGEMKSHELTELVFVVVLAAAPFISNITLHSSLLGISLVTALSIGLDYLFLRSGQTS